MSTELLPKVEVWRLPEHVTRALKDAMRIVLDERDHRASALVGGMRAKEAATYLGIGRSKFYQLLKHDADLMGSSFGVGTARMWRKEDLDAWMHAQVVRTSRSCEPPATMKAAATERSKTHLRVKTSLKPKR